MSSELAFSTIENRASSQPQAVKRTRVSCEVRMHTRAMRTSVGSKSETLLAFLNIDRVFPFFFFAGGFAATYVSPGSFGLP